MSQQVRIYRMLDLSPAALTPFTSRLYPVMRLGDRATEVNVKMTGSVGAQHLDPVQFNLNITGANPSATSTINTIYQNITHDTINMPNLRLKCADWNIVVAKDIQDAYIYQGEIDITTTTTIAIGGEACVSGLVMNAQAGTITGSVVGQIIAMRGASMPTLSYGLIIRAETGAILNKALWIGTTGGTTITHAIYVENAGTIINPLTFNAVIDNAVAVTAGHPLADIKGESSAGYIRVLVGATARYIPLYAATG